MEISLAGKRAFITAGGDGMGRTTALTMDRLGAEVFTCDIDPTGLETLPDSITTWRCDVTDSAALNAIFDEILPDGPPQAVPTRPRLPGWTISEP